MRRFWVTATVLPVLYGALFLGFPIHKAHNRIKPFLKANLAAIVKEQESRVGIKYGSIPKFGFTYPISPNERKIAIKYDNTGEGVIKIVPASVLVGDENSLERILNKFVFGGEKPILDGINHDVVHVYLDQRREEMRREGKNPPRILSGTKLSDTSGGTMFALKLVEEGVATYVERLMSQNDSQFKHLDEVDYLGRVEQTARVISDWNRL